MKVTMSGLTPQKLVAVKNSKINSVLSNPINFNVVDSVNFSGNIKRKKINVDMETAKIVANSLSTSTSGHRAQYNSETFNPAIVELLTLGVAKYAKDIAKERGVTPVVAIGGDTREATRKSLPLIEETLANQGVIVYSIKDPVPTPLLAHMTKDNDIDIAILMTASHNPWEDGGYNLVTKEGAIAPAEVTKQVAQNALDYAEKGSFTIDKRKRAGIIDVNPYRRYSNLINSYGLIDWKEIKDSGISVYYDALHGTGKNVMPKLLSEHNIPFTMIDAPKKSGPNPTDANLGELKYSVQNDENPLAIGLANDGDADRFGVVDENGQFISPNDVLLLVAHHLKENKGVKGTIIRSQATSSQIDIFAKNNGLNVIQTPVGFKFIGEDIMGLRRKGKDILVAGEESGGLTINKHVPEKDGILVDLLLLDMVATEKKPLSQILKETKEGLGVEFRTVGYSKRYPTDVQKEKVLARMQKIYSNCLNGEVQFGDFEIDVEKTSKNMEAMRGYKKGGDGYKLYFTDGSNVLIRKSGTEPLVRAYIETYDENASGADNKVEQLRSQLDSILDV